MSKKAKSDNFESVRQKIFAAKTDKEKKMWEAILRKLENDQAKKD